MVGVPGSSPGEGATVFLVETINQSLKCPNGIGRHRPKVVGVFTVEDELIGAF